MTGRAAPVFAAMLFAACGTTPTPAPVPVPPQSEPAPPSAKPPATVRRPPTPPAPPVPVALPPPRAVTSLNIIGPSNPIRRGTSMQWIEIERTKREYTLFVPAGFDERRRVPLVVVLHPRNVSAAAAAQSYGFAAVAERERFLVAYPQALGGWNTGHEETGARADDGAFIEALVDSLVTMLSIDFDRVYLVGHGLGGAMAYRLAARTKHRFAGVAAVGGTIGSATPRGDAATIPPPATPIPVLHVHGTRDANFPFEGGATSTTRTPWLSAKESVAFWVRANQCRAAPASLTVGNFTIDTYAECRAPVQFITVRGGTQEWPRALRLQESGYPSVAEVVWSFFARR